MKCSKCSVEDFARFEWYPIAGRLTLASTLAVKRNTSEIFAPEMFSTSRLLDFFTEDALRAEIGYEKTDWPLAVLKELVDNAIDACEDGAVDPNIHVKIDTSGITISDNGPGLPADVIRRILDFSSRTSSRAAYVQPSRGRQGNALKCILAMPFVLDGNEGRLSIHSQAIRHEIGVKLDAINQKPVVKCESTHDEVVKNGTSFSVHWPDSSRSILESAKDRFLQLATDYSVFNPHLTMTVDWQGDVRATMATAPGWKKWRPSDPSSAHWYTQGQFDKLVTACISQDEAAGHYRPLRDFLAAFDGMKASAKQKAILDQLGFHRVSISVLRNGHGVDHERTAMLLHALQQQTNEVKPKALGIIGQSHFRTRFGEIGADLETFQYKRFINLFNGRPWIVEAAFAYREGQTRYLMTGVNWSPCIGNPFTDLGGDSLDGVLEEQRAGPSKDIVVAVHYTCPDVSYTNRGKSALAFAHLQKMTYSDFDLEEFEHSGDQKSSISTNPMLAIKKSAMAVTRDWAKQQRREERDANAKSRRQEALNKSRRMTFKDAIAECIEECYDHYTNGGQSPAQARQLMYRARPRIQELTGRYLNDKYFTNKLLPQFIDENRELTKDWDVIYDARGKLIEPHTGHIVPLGTLDVRRYIDECRTGRRGPKNRYQAILFVEKEGFAEIFKHFKLAERYDVAIASTKGVHVTAFRMLIDWLCSKYSIPVLILHDFDKAGFSIIGTLKRDTARYTFKNKINVIDVGFRLEDIRKLGLNGEVVHYGKSDPTENLRENGATPDEINFLYDHARSHRGHHIGRRVELNEPSNADLIAYIEEKFKEHGIKKVIPDENTLELQYRRAATDQITEKALARIRRKAERAAKALKMPEDLRRLVSDALNARPAMPWDSAISDIVAKMDLGELKL